ncbi:pyridoxamine 5'-phosphate oxidase family protein [Streptomyces purpurogeneiscleroticus]|uniref:pyridoxamine 5'-phosphate oxidase family protein n=1 Tax=Streptomyces purpurogeneiscleroticus TaxID=68259 RepID=UPI001CBFAB35|nr:pyridoxamine 5'-phosphate oxidase family protein [Streptomyces purpurogeneiscleroticus]
MSVSIEELCETAAEILRTTRYMTLGTASAAGVPMVTPLAHAWDDQDAFYWISGTDAVHSLNIEHNPVVSIVVFDSNPTDGGGQGLYAHGRAEVLHGEALDEGCEVYYSRRYPDPAKRAKRYQPPAQFRDTAPNRLYRARIESYSVLNPDGHPVHGDEVSHRVTIPFRTGRLSGTA